MTALKKHREVSYEQLLEMDHEDARKVLRKRGRLDTRHAALYLGIPKRTFEQFRTGGRGPVWLNIEGRIYYAVEALDIYEKRAETHPEEASA